MLLAENDGDIAESYRYKEFGEQTVVDNSFAKLSTLTSNIGNWKRYTGQEHALPSSVSDPWYFYRARAYRADAGRFVQRDPPRFVHGSNSFLYVRGRPMDLTDPLGMFATATGGRYANVGGINIVEVHGATPEKWEQFGWCMTWCEWAAGWAALDTCPTCPDVQDAKDTMHEDCMGSSDPDCFSKAWELFTHSVTYTQCIDCAQGIEQGMDCFGTCVDSVYGGGGDYCDPFEGGSNPFSNHRGAPPEVY
jgi:RHS repeat-associated protein